MLKHFLQFKDLTRDELLYLFERTRLIKSCLLYTSDAADE